MTLIVDENYRELTRQISPRAWKLIKWQARAHDLTLSAVIYQYPDLVPRRLRELAKACFVETRHEWLLARREALQKTLRKIEKELERGR